MLALSCAGFGQGVVAQVRLRVGGRQSNYGARTLAPGFFPDPFRVQVVSGGTLDARAAGLPQGCVGFVTSQPDFIVRMTGNSASLRMYVTAPGDTTLLVNTGRGRWVCNDDSFGGVNPTVELPSMGAGQYDVWVGSYHPGQALTGTLHVTEIADNHP